MPSTILISFPICFYFSLMVNCSAGIPLNVTYLGSERGFYHVRIYQQFMMLYARSYGTDVFFLPSWWSRELETHFAPYQFMEVALYFACTSYGKTALWTSMSLGGECMTQCFMVCQIRGGWRQTGLGIDATPLGIGLDVRTRRRIDSYCHGAQCRL